MLFPMQQQLALLNSQTRRNLKGKQAEGMSLN